MLIEDILEQGEVLSFSIDSVHANVGRTITTSKRQISLAFKNLFHHPLLMHSFFGTSFSFATDSAISSTSFLVLPYPTLAQLFRNVPSPVSSSALIGKVWGLV